MEHRAKGNLALKEKKVIEIKASQHQESVKLRVAAYARVSSDSADQLNSFMAQTTHYTTLIASKENWELADIYTDAGITGTSAEKRADFQRLLSDCRKGKVDRILTKSVSRFARNTKDCLETIRELKTLGVSIYFEEQGIDTGKMNGELLTAMFASMAQSESESISGNMRWSYQQRMKSGEFTTCKAPFGYRLKNGTLEVYEPEAKIVRMIFEQYLAGNSRDDIAEQVTALNVPTRDGKSKWQHSTITYILCNEKYVGDALLQKKYTTDTLPYQKRRNHGEKDKFIKYGSHPAIVDRETFDAVACLLKERGKKISIIRQNNPLSQKIKCCVCGSTFRHTSCNQIDYWVCRRHFKNKDNCPVSQIRESEIHAAFLRVYHKLKFHGEAILHQMISNLQTIRERRMLWSLDIVELNKRISDLADQDRMLADMNRLGLVDPDIYIAQNNELTWQMQAAKQERERLIGTEHDDTIQKTEELMEALDCMPEYLPDFDGEIFNDLIVKIKATKDSSLIFQLKNGLELIEQVERRSRR